jgi:hypothetical protein
MAVGCVVQLCLQYDTLDKEYNSEHRTGMRCHTPPKQRNGPPRGYRAAVRAADVRETSYRYNLKNHAYPHPLALPVAGCPRTSHSLRAARRSAISAYPTVVRGLRPPTRTVNDRRPTCGPNHRTNAPVTASRSTAAPPTVAPNCRDANMNAAPPCLQPPHLHRGANGGRRSQLPRRKYERSPSVLTTAAPP